MPTIITVDSQTPISHTVYVASDGFEKAAGKLLAGKKITGEGAEEVGEWTAEAFEDGSGVASTPRGVFLFATQGGAISAPFPLPEIVGG